jgi:hypothetical protein
MVRYDGQGTPVVPFRLVHLAQGPDQVAQAGLGEAPFVLGDRTVHGPLERDGGVLRPRAGLQVVRGPAVGGRGRGDVEHPLYGCPRLRIVPELDLGVRQYGVPVRPVGCHPGGAQPERAALRELVPGIGKQPLTRHGPVVVRGVEGEGAAQQTSSRRPPEPQPRALAASSARPRPTSTTSRPSRNFRALPEGQADARHAPRLLAVRAVARRRSSRQASVPYCYHRRCTRRYGLQPHNTAPGSDPRATLTSRNSELPLE